MQKPSGDFEIQGLLLCSEKEPFDVFIHILSEGYSGVVAGAV